MGFSLHDLLQTAPWDEAQVWWLLVSLLRLCQSQEQVWQKALLQGGGTQMGGTQMGVAQMGGCDRWLLIPSCLGLDQTGAWMLYPASEDSRDSIERAFRWSLRQGPKGSLPSSWASSWARPWASPWPRRADQGLDEPRPRAAIAILRYSLGLLAVQALTGLQPVELLDRQGDWVWEQFLGGPVSGEMRSLVNGLLFATVESRYPDVAAVLREIPAPWLGAYTIPYPATYPIACPTAEPSAEPSAGTSWQQQAIAMDQRIRSLGWLEACVDPVILDPAIVDSAILDPAIQPSSSPLSSPSLSSGDGELPWLALSEVGDVWYGAVPLTPTASAPPIQPLVLSSLLRQYWQRQFPGQSLPRMSALAMHPHRPWFVLGHGDGQLSSWRVRWQVDTGAGGSLGVECWARWQAPESRAVRGVQFHPWEPWVAYCQGAALVLQPLLEAGAEVGAGTGAGAGAGRKGGVALVLPGHRLAIQAIAVSWDGLHWATASRDTTVRLWRGQGLDWRVERVLRSHTAAVRALAFSPDGRWLVSGGDDRLIHCWEVATGQLWRSFSGHSWPVRALHVSSDGQWLVSAGWDQQILVWSMVGDGEQTPSRSVQAEASVDPRADPRDGHLQASQQDWEAIALSAQGPWLLAGGSGGLTAWYKGPV